MSKFSNAPIPSINFLLKAFFNKKKNKGSFSNSWQKEGYSTFPFSRSSRSMEFIVNYKFHISESSKLTLLFPSYFCNSSLLPLRKKNIKLLFYPINKDGSPKVDEFASFFDKFDIDIVFAAHYFGMRNDFSNIYSIAKANGAWFVEDCAHLLMINEEIGHESDFILFSPHKFLPISDGALLLVNNDLLNTRSKQENFCDLHGIYTSSSENWRPYLWLIKRLIQKLSIGINTGIKDFFEDPVVNSDAMLKPGISDMSKALLLEMSKNLDEEQKARIAKAKSWKKIVINRFPSADVLFGNDKSNSIYMQGLTFEDRKVLLSALEWFNQMKFPISSWPDLPEEVLSDQDYYKDSLELRFSTVFFQVHSSISQKDIESAS